MEMADLGGRKEALSEWVGLKLPKSRRSLAAVVPGDGPGAVAVILFIYFFFFFGEERILLTDGDRLLVF